MQTHCTCGYEFGGGMVWCPYCGTKRGKKNILPSDDETPLHKLITIAADREDADDHLSPEQRCYIVERYKREAPDGQEYVDKLPADLDEAFVSIIYD